MDETSEQPPSQRWWGDADPVLRAEDLVTALPAVPEEAPPPARRKGSFAKGMSFAAVTLLVAIIGTSAATTSRSGPGAPVAGARGDGAAVAAPTPRATPAPDPTPADVPDSAPTEAEPVDAYAANNPISISRPSASPTARPPASTPRVVPPVYTPPVVPPVAVAPVPAPAPARGTAAGTSRAAPAWSHRRRHQPRNRPPPSHRWRRSRHGNWPGRRRRSRRLRARRPRRRKGISGHTRTAKATASAEPPPARWGR